MRVIAGQFRSRRLESIPGIATRPTPDRLRETLFDILAPRIEGAVFLDAYAGTGAVGIEALSRGARHAIFLERSRAALEVIHRNLGALGLDAHATVLAAPVLAALPRHRADIVFADPPYESDAYTALLDALAEAPPPLAVIQHAVRRDLPAEHRGLERTRLLKQGDNALSFYEGTISNHERHGDVPPEEATRP
jgi:16S rRNA (guanine966-N2)-methyltransferase